MRSEKKIVVVLAIISLITLSGNLVAQKSNSQYIETIIKEIKEKKSGMLGYASSSINHIYEINIPNNAEIKDYETIYTVNPVEITMAVTNGYYNIYKAKISYKVTFYKEFKGSYVHCTKGDMTTIWSVTIETSDFTSTLKGLKNLKNTEFDLIYGAEDDFPQDWKK